MSARSATIGLNPAQHLPLTLLASLALVVGLVASLSACSDDGEVGAEDAAMNVGDGDGDSEDTGDGDNGGAGMGDGDSAGMGDGDMTVPTEPEFVVELDAGMVGGTMDHGARRFLKIPYARAPLGDLRWRAPSDPEPWDGTLFSGEFAGSCPQLADQGAPASEDEDCLYLNVWAPDPMPSDAPVMMWIHGGGNFSGGAGIPIPSTQRLWFDGHVFAEQQGVVVVTINYRLGPLGFMAHPALAGEDEPRGNQGLLDQRKALSWIRDNIAAFGGDPDNVTIFGESAGSADVCYHVASPGSEGLFHRAISQSGGCTIRTIGEETTPEDTAEQMVAYGEALGCPEGDEQLDCMREVPIETILEHSMQPAPGAGGGFDGEWSFAAVIDGPDGFLPDELRTLFDEGRFADVPYLLGANNDEGTTFLWRADPVTSEEDYRAQLQMRYGDVADQVFDLYPPSAYEDNPQLALEAVVGDAVVCSTHDTARRVADAGRPVFLYNFNVAWGLSPETFRAGHAAEISMVFGTPLLRGNDADADADREAVSAAMNAYWAQFAAAGDPNHDDAPAEWPAFASDDDKRLELAPEFPVREDFRTEECAFWRGQAGAE